MRTALVLVAAAACGGSSSPPPVATPLEPPPAAAPPSAPSGEAAPPNMPVVIPAGDVTACQRSTECSLYTHGARERPAAGEARPYGPDRTFQVVSGNLASGPVSVLVHIKAGTQPFWHMHRRDVHMVVVDGTVEFVQSGAGVHSLEPGSYVRQPGGYKHSERCTSSIDCVLYIHSEQDFSVTPL